MSFWNYIWSRTRAARLVSTRVNTEGESCFFAEVVAEGGFDELETTCPICKARVQFYDFVTVSDPIEIHSVNHYCSRLCALKALADSLVK